MGTAPIDVYVAAFTARAHVRRHPGQTAVNQLGLHGLLACAEDPLTRLLVTEDRAHDALTTVLPKVGAGMIDVLGAAARCTELVGRDPGWRPEGLTAMTCDDLRAVPASPLPAGLSLRPVTRRAGDAECAVALRDAVATAIRADPKIAQSPGALAGYLRSLPSAFRLLAAVDGDGVVRATSGVGAFGSEATVIFVNTEPDWRGRGIGHAMTAAALRAAREAGARRAGLDASDAGQSIYRRLGFDVVGPMTRFSRAG